MPGSQSIRVLLPSCTHPTGLGQQGPSPLPPEALPCPVPIHNLARKDLALSLRFTDSLTGQSLTVPQIGPSDIGCWHHLQTCLGEPPRLSQLCGSDHNPSAGSHTNVLFSRETVLTYWQTGPTITLPGLPPSVGLVVLDPGPQGSPHAMDTFPPPSGDSRVRRV